MFKGVSSMDDFANMLIAKHESTLSQYDHQVRTSYAYYEEIKKPKIYPIPWTDNDITLPHQYNRWTNLKRRKMVSEKKSKSPR